MGSLRSTLIRRLAFLQAVILLAIVLMAVNGTWLFVAGSGYYESGAMDALEDAVYRRSDVHLALDSTPALARIRRESANLWFVIRDERGMTLSGGQIPERYRAVLDELPYLGRLEFSKPASAEDSVTALARWRDTAAGRVQIFTIAHPFLSWRRLLGGASYMSLVFSLPILALVVIVTVLATPVIVTRAFAGLEALRRQADAIDVDREGVRLSASPVPAEVQPLVEAVNAALDRLDRGYERQRRLLADAAHELRTPIAILNAHVEDLPPGPDRQRLSEDAARLSTLAGQLLDLQRLELQPARFRKLELNALARRVIAAIAPLAFRAGYGVDFQPAPGEVWVEGDETALERALSNLLQNAIDHGGRRGEITLLVSPEGSLSVMDEGEGVPQAARERIFEPFHRLGEEGRGAGLGLNLVQRIAGLHQGRVDCLDREGKAGACFRLTLPVPKPSARA